MRDNLKIPYGVSDFKRVISEGYYYIDKSAYIRTLEEAGSFLFFVRPRRFGKSLFASMLRCYYDISEKENFQTLFGELDIGREPTENVNRFQVLYMDFSEVNRGDADISLQQRFENYIGKSLDSFIDQYGKEYGDQFVGRFYRERTADKFTMVAKHARLKGFHLYLILDEYDNFTNAMLRTDGSPE